MQILIEREGSCTKRDIAVLAMAIGRVEAIKATDGLVEISQIKRCSTGNLHTARPKGMIGNAGLCGACFNIQPARETVVARKGRGSGATLEHFANAADLVGKRKISSLVDGQITIAIAGTGQHDGAGWINAAAFTQCQQAFGDGGGAGIGVGTGEHQLSSPGLAQTFIAFDHRGDGGGHGRALQRSVTDNDQLIIGARKRERAAGEQIAIGHELHAIDGRGKAGIDGDGSGCAAKNRKAIIDPRRIGCAIGAGPIVIGSIPGAAAALDDAIILWPSAIPEEEVASAGIDQIDLMVDGGLQAVIGSIAGDGADRHGVGGQIAIIIKDTIDTGADHTASIDIEGTIERQIAVHIKQRIGRLATAQGHIGLASGCKGQIAVEDQLLAALSKQCGAGGKTGRADNRAMAAEIGLIRNGDAAAQCGAIKPEITGLHIHSAGIGGAVAAQRQCAGAGLLHRACTVERRSDGEGVVGIGNVEATATCAPVDGAGRLVEIGAGDLQGAAIDQQGAAAQIGFLRDRQRA
ncbi:hypothetical protein Brsp05_04707 [Brucella sp. NBRC 12953]